MARFRTSDLVFLLALLLLELLIFTGSFGKFFNHDSLFYITETPRSWQDFVKLLSAPDAAGNYRPLTLGLMAPVTAWFGLNPFPYHWIPILFHLLNTCLFYVLARRLIADRLSVLATVAFWGLHSVAGWITYDNTYLSDFLLVFFALLSLILAVDSQAKGSLLRLGGSLVLFIAALLSKEAALTLPLALFLCLGLAGLRDSEQRATFRDIWPHFKRAIPLTALFLCISLIFAGLFMSWLRAGSLYTQGLSQAYDISLWANLPAKTKYFYWAFNLPDKLQIDHPNRTRAAVLVLMGGLLSLWAIDLLRRKGKLTPLEWGGLIWFVGLNLPAWLLSNRLGKWYLYLPIMGLALTLGSFAARLRDGLTPFAGKKAVPLAMAILIIPWLVSSTVQTRSFLNSSDSSYASDVVQNLVRDFQEAHPSVPSGITLFLLPTFEKNVADLFGGGKLYQLYYPQSRIRMVFADKGEKLPSDYVQRSDLWILQYLYGHVYDVSDYYKGRRHDPSTRRLITSLEQVRASVSRDEFYETYEHFDTPGGTPVFFPTPDKEIFTQIGGATARIPLDDIPRHASLRFDVSWMYDAGDGGWAEMKLQAAGKDTILFRQLMTPNPEGKGLRWREVRVDLQAFEGQDAQLFLVCYNSVGKTTVADWLNWRNVVLEKVNREKTELALPPANTNRGQTTGKAQPSG